MPLMERGRQNKRPLDQSNFFAVPLLQQHKQEVLAELAKEQVKAQGQAKVQGQAKTQATNQAQSTLVAPTLVPAGVAPTLVPAGGAAVSRYAKPQRPAAIRKHKQKKKKR